MGVSVKKAGAVGMVILSLNNERGEGLISEAHFIPTVQLGRSSSQTVQDYVTTIERPRGKIIIRGTKLNTKPAPMVAAFSSRGPNPVSPFIIKPDLIAPGVDILAAWPDDVSPTEDFDTRRTKFNIASGTSMSCPHISAIAALLKGYHTNWSPARIRSAMMTTAYVIDNEGSPLLDESTYNNSSVWSYGSGHVDPEKALDPGLVFDLTPDDYLNFLCASNYSKSDIEAIAGRPVKCVDKELWPWDLNYPSISVTFNESDALRYEAIVKRTATHVGDRAASYTDGIIVTVDPSKLEFSHNEENQTYLVKISAEKFGTPLREPRSVFSKMIWGDGTHVVNVPIAITWQPNHELRNNQSKPNQALSSTSQNSATRLFVLLAIGGFSCWLSMDSW